MKKKYLLFLVFAQALVYAQSPGSVSPVLHINATIPYQGFGENIPRLGAAQYQIFYDNVDGLFDKPILLIDGFDPNDSRDIPAVYALLDYGMEGSNLGDMIRNEGYDLIVVNFEESYASATDDSTIRGGADFIQRNAFTIVELIKTINDAKEGTDQNVIIGPSMGGLISTYALRYMELNQLKHDTRLHISFDAPHKGANVPIGMQYIFNYMVNGDPKITEAAPLVNGLLNSAAAKQMLIDHYLGHVNAGGVTQDTNLMTPIGAPNFRDAFQAEMNAMGFPQNTRNVAISNGSGTGQMTGTPGMELLKHTFNLGLVDTGLFPIFSRAKVAIHFAPLANDTIVVADLLGQAGLTPFGPWIDAFTYKASASSSPNSDGLDSAPGGKFDLFSFDAIESPIMTEFIDNLNSQYFNFIPTLSSLAISDTSNWYSAPDLTTSPFANSYIPSENQPHITLTADNVAFALSEILQGTLGNVEFADQFSMKLQKNPIQDSFTLLTNTDIGRAHVSIVDITGKLVFNKQETLSSHTSIPINLEPGLYVLKVRTSENHQFTTKLIVN